MLGDERRFDCGTSLVRILLKFHVEFLVVVGRFVVSHSGVARHETLGSSK